MSSLANKYSDWQIYGFFGLFLANTIWIHYASFLVKSVVGTNDVVSSLQEMAPFLVIYVGIPLGISFLISFKMYNNGMLSKPIYAVLLLSGFLVSLIFVVSDYLFLGK